VGLAALFRDELSLGVDGFLEGGFDLGLAVGGGDFPGRRHQRHIGGSPAPTLAEAESTNAAAAAVASAGEAAANVDTAIQTLIQELLPVGPGCGCLEGVRALTQLLSPSYP